MTADLAKPANPEPVYSERYLPLLRKLKEALTKGEIPIGDKELKVPVSHYLSEQRFAKEKDKLLTRTPLLACHSSEVAKPGDYIKYDYFGKPTIIIRGDDNIVRCLIDSCCHRGSQLKCPEQSGHLKSLVCPYHGWTYATDGTLKHIPHPEAFDSMQPGNTALSMIAVNEVDGLIWLLPDDPLNTFEEFIDPIAKDIGSLGLEHYEVVHAVSFPVKANWKLIIEAFLEGYHIQRLHRNSVGPFFVEGQGWGEDLFPHVLTASSRKTLAGVDAQQLEQHLFSDLVTFTYLIFPFTKLLLHPDYISIMTMAPMSAGEFQWTHRMLIHKDQNRPELQQHWQDSFELVEKGVFEKEDLFIAKSMHRGLSSGAHEHTTLGKLEFPAHWLHRNIDEYMSR